MNNHRFVEALPHQHEQVSVSFPMFMRLGVHKCAFFGKHRVKVRPQSHTLKRCFDNLLLCF